MKNYLLLPIIKNNNNNNNLRPMRSNHLYVVKKLRTNYKLQFDILKSIIYLYKA